MMTDAEWSAFESVTDPDRRPERVLVWQDWSPDRMNGGE